MKKTGISLFGKIGRGAPLSATFVISLVFSSLVIFFFLAITAFLFCQGLPSLIKGWPVFFTKADWYFRAGHYGAAAMIYGSTVVVGIAVIFAAPMAFGGAILTSEYIKGPARFVVKSFMELLAGIPSVVYGLLGLLYLRPVIFNLFGKFHPESGDNLITAGILVGVMILPTVLSLSDDAFRSVSKEEKESAKSLGLTRHETFFHAIFPKAFPGLVAAVLLGIGRALGETIAVFLVVGRADNRLPSPWYSLEPFLRAGQTITSKLGGSEVNLAYGNFEHWSAVVALGLLLFVIVIFLVFISEITLLSMGKYRS